MREILFRGKRTDTGEWVEGYFCKNRIADTCYIAQSEGGDCCNEYFADYEVIPETVGQYTGLTDCNGKKIFEGDIVKAQDEIWGSPFCYGITGKIVYDESAYFIEPKNPIESQWLFNECAVYEVLGNIHDNPEMLNNV
jgi:uncharacterized phage protein (TIGR01671 family)